MFQRQRKPEKFKFIYGKSPFLTNSSPKNFRRFTPTKRPHPILNKIKKIFILLAGTAIIFLGIYGLFFSNYFNIKEILITNANLKNEHLSNEIKSSLKSYLGKNLIFLNTENLNTKIRTKFPALETVKITKEYFDKLAIEFSEYPLIANVINESDSMKKSYIINAIGFAIKEDYENPNLPFIRIKSDEPVNTNSQLISPEKIKYILDATTYYRDKFGMGIREIEYKPTAREIRLLTDRNFTIWMDIQKPFDQQFKKLKKALVKLDIYKTNLEYIDLRISGNNGEKIIYRRRS